MTAKKIDVKSNLKAINTAFENLASADSVKKGAVAIIANNSFALLQSGDLNALAELQAIQNNKALNSSGKSAISQAKSVFKANPDFTGSILTEAKRMRDEKRAAEKAKEAEAEAAKKSAPVIPMSEQVTKYLLHIRDTDKETFAAIMASVLPKTAAVKTKKAA